MPKIKPLYPFSLGLLLFLLYLECVDAGVGLVAVQFVLGHNELPLGVDAEGGGGELPGVSGRIVLGGLEAGQKGGKVSMQRDR